MSKKKNTLRDLDEFLKQQAATLVAPNQLSDAIKETESFPVSRAAESIQAHAEVTSESILHDLKYLSQKEGPAFRETLYNLIIKSLEIQSPSQPEDKMLINTALYLKGGEHWKETIRAYWKEKASSK